MGKSDTESILVICKGTIKASAGWHAGGQRDGVGSEQGGDEVDKKPQTQHTTGHVSLWSVLLREALPWGVGKT